MILDLATESNKKRARLSERDKKEKKRKVDNMMMRLSATADPFWDGTMSSGDSD